jgi:hypothetical protein
VDRLDLGSRERRKTGGRPIWPAPEQLPSLVGVERREVQMLGQSIRQCGEFTVGKPPDQGSLGQNDHRR